MSAKKALAIATSLGYSLGRDGKKGYYVRFFINDVQVIRWQLAPEMKLAEVVKHMQLGTFKA